MSDDSSDDEIPVAHLARYKHARHKTEKKKDTLARPKKDLSVGSDETDAEGSDENDSEGSDENDSVDSDYHGEEDAMAQRRYLNKQRLERGRARAAIGEPFLHPIHPKTTTKKPRPTNKQITLWENEATQRMMESTNCDDLLAAHMLLVHVKLGPWESEMSMFFLVGHVLQIDPFHFLHGNPREANLLSVLMFEENKWTVPKVPNMATNVETLCKIAHQIISKEWKKTKDRVEGQHAHTIMTLAKSTDAAVAATDATVVVNLSTVKLPPCPEFSSLKASVNKGRAHMWKLWWGHPECSDRDVSGDVVQWAASNLMSPNTHKDF